MSISKALLGLGAVLSLTVPTLVLAQYYGPVGTLVVTTTLPSGVPVPTVTIMGSGPSLSGVPSSQNSLTYTPNNISDSRVITLIPGTYWVSTSGTSGYSFNYSSGCNGTITAGQTQTCAIVANNSGTGLATLTVYTNGVIYNNSYPQNFTINVNGNSPVPSVFTGSPSGTTVTLQSGAYSVNPQNVAGFTTTQSGDCSGTVQSGETRSCTITYTSLSNTNYGLSCYTATPVVPLGSNAVFNAQGGSGTFNWTTADRIYTNIGPTLSATLSHTGQQLVTVSSGAQTATCSVNVVPAGTYTPTYPNYPSYPTYPIYPTLPSTGFEPQSGFGLALALVFLIAAGFIVSPYVRKAAASLRG